MDMTHGESTSVGNDDVPAGEIGSQSAVPASIPSSGDAPLPFCLAYSCGKDSTLALHRLVRAGHRPVALIVTVNEGIDRSWFHGVDRALRERVSASLGIPILEAACGADGSGYEAAFVDALRRAREMGAAGAAFGDIDIEEHRAWDTSMAEAAGLVPLLPLWQEDRRRLTHEVIDAGYRAVIKVVHKQHGLPASMLGRVLDAALVEEIAALGADPCGENGEYHTFVVDGPLFRQRIACVADGVHDGEHAVSLVLRAE